PCDLAERADVLVYDAWASGDAEGARTLIENIRDIHPETPVVLTSPGLALSWEETSGPHAVTTVLGQPTGARLHEAIQASLGAVTPARTCPEQQSERFRWVPHRAPVRPSMLCSRLRWRRGRRT